METIELNIWEPVPNEPGHVRIADQRTAQEVFAELKHRLESIGYLPDEYFLLGDEWENGRKIPEGADIFCTADYGGSEGIYLDIYLKWHEDNKSLTKSFVTGKTLEETPIALDRMHLVASEVMKAFHGDGSIHARYMRIGGSAVPAGAVFHLNPQEHRLMVDSLVEHRNRIKDEFEGVEHLLRRVTGSITEFVNEVGERPLKISDFDRTMLSIQDGNLSEFRMQYMGAWGISAFESDAGWDALSFIRESLPEDGKLELKQIIEDMRREKWYIPDVSDGDSHTGPMMLAEIVVKFIDQDISELDYDEEWAEKENKFSAIASFAADKDSLKWLRGYISDTLESAKANAVYRAEHAAYEWDLRGGWREEQDWLGWQEHMSTLVNRLDTLISSPDNIVELNQPQEQVLSPSMDM